MEKNGLSTGMGRSSRAHWRRGHWWRQRHGLELALETLRFLRPMCGMHENGTPVKMRIYDVDEQTVLALNTPL